MNLLLKYVSQNDMTLMLLAGLTVSLTANQKTKINRVWVPECGVYVTDCENLETLIMLQNEIVFRQYGIS